MTETQKKIAIIVGTIVIALILLMSRKAGATTIEHKDMPPIQVSIPSLNLPPRDPIAIIIPGLPSVTPYQYSAISPCMCNGAASTGSYQGPLLEFVTNQAGAGANVYNYNQPSYSSDLGFTGVYTG